MLATSAWEAINKSKMNRLFEQHTAEIKNVTKLCTFTLKFDGPSAQMVASEREADR